jgi:hypothetical protein
MKRKAVLFTAIQLLLMCFAFKAQIKLLSKNQSPELFKTWYESPHQSSNDTLCFTTTKYIINQAIDNPAFAFAIIDFKNTNAFAVEYWRWCPAANWAYEGSWTELEQDKFKFDFGAGKCKCEVKIISLTGNQLKVKITEVN